MTEYILLGVIALQAILHCIERRDLYNRIMSRDLKEYKGQERSYMPSAHDRVLKRWRRKDADK